MTKKTAPLSGQGEKGQSAETNINHIRNTHTRQGYVSYYPGKGVKLSAPDLIATAGPGGRKKAITGWSKSSRRRMRMALLTSTGPAGYKAYGISLTVPGHVVLYKEYSEMWKYFCRELDKHNWCAVWRVEVQQRGALHWHMILWAPSMSPLIARRRAYTNELPTEFVIDHEWNRAISTLGFSTSEYWWKGPDERWYKPYSYLCPRYELPGAWKYKINIQSEQAERGAWLRYLQDHATKAKQEQIPESIGRHWGIIGRKHIIKVDPEETISLTRKQYYRMLRWYQRMCCPSFESATAPFGRKLGYRPSRGSRGNSVWFSRPDTVAQLVSRAIASDGPLPLESRKSPLPLPP